MQSSLRQLEQIVGRENLGTSPEELSARQADGMSPSVVAKPADPAQIAEVLRFAASEKLAVIPSGSGTKLGIGSLPARYDIALDVSRLNRIQAYDPQDLTLGVDPGVKIADLLGVLAEQKQFLPLAVAYSERATVGGIVAANSSSPLRHAYGGVRDFCLGMEFVTGEGVAAKSGGRVVKNVTGYDLHKLLIGSLGTLGVITRVNFRTFPLQPAQGTFVATFPSAVGAFNFCIAIAHSPLAPQIVEVANPAAARILLETDSTPHAASRIAASQWAVIISAAGQAEIVQRSASEIGRMASKASAEELIPLDESESPSVLARIREFPRLILEAAQAAIFRIGVLPSAMARLTSDLDAIATRSGAELLILARASGLIYAAVIVKGGGSAASIEQAAAQIFRACEAPEIGALAMLEWAPPQVKAACGGVWGKPRPDFGLMRKVKQSFDPGGVLSPGRFAGGI